MSNRRRRRPDRKVVKELDEAINEAICSSPKVESLLKGLTADGYSPQWDVAIRFPLPPRPRRGHNTPRQFVKDGEVTEGAFHHADDRWAHRLGIGPVSG